MRISLMTEPHMGGTYDQFLAMARWAEQQGLASFARSDHFYADRSPRPEATEAMTHLAGLSRETDHIRLCVLVAPLTFRHPALLAKTAATIDQMSGGRLDLGVGTGWMEIEHQAFGLDFPPWSERFERLEEYLQYLEAAFTQERAIFRGKFYRIGAEVRPRPQNLRLVIGGSGPRRTPALAGRYADEYNLFVGAPQDLAPKIEVLTESAEKAGRDPEKVEISLLGPVAMGRDRSEFLEVLSARVAQHSDGITVEEYERKLRDAHAVAGTPEQVGELISSWQQVGVSKYYIQWFDSNDLTHLDHQYQTLRQAL